MTPSFRGLFVLPVLPLLAACGPSPFELRVNAARDAAAHGDLANEALNWEQACLLEPGEKEACASAKDAVARYRTASLAAGKVPCEAGQVPECVKAIGGYRALRPKDPDLLDLLLAAGRAHEKNCTGIDDGKSLDGQVVALLCLEESQKDLSISTYDALVAERRAAAAVKLRELSTTKVAGERWFLRRTAACISGSSISDADLIAAQADFVRAAAIPATVRVSGTNLNGDLCPQVQSVIGPRAVCMPTAQADFDVRVQANLGPPNHRVTEEVKAARYKSGTRQVPNPRYSEAERDYLTADSSAREAESQLARAQSDCYASGQRASICGSLSSYASHANSARSARESARSRMASTPTTVLEDVYSDVNYVVRTHEWLVPATVTAQRGSGKDPASTTTQFAYSDIEREGVPQAGIDRDPLSPPGAHTFDSALQDASVKAAAAVVERAFAQVATCSFEGASIDAPGLECRVRSNFYTSSTLPEPRLWMGKFRCEK